MTETEIERELWIFGYGSLVWRPAFPFVERRTGWVEGWARRFWQASTDHRGVPDDPGRVVTLIATGARARCWGAAYRVEPSAAPGVLAGLDHREKGGYRRITVDVSLSEGGALSGALMYLATEDNPNYAGPAPIEAIAEQVRRCRGPSGTNVEYVVRLAEALQALGVPEAEDAHVFELARLVGLPEP